MKVSGEEGDVRQEAFDSWQERSKEIVRDRNPENVWNMDETGCFRRALPDTTLNQKRKHCSVGKTSKQRNTWPFFVNVAGVKEEPVIIGRVKKTRCFKKAQERKAL